MIIAGIDEAGDAVLEQFGGGERRGELHVLGLERGLVRIHPVEQERLGVGLVGEPARELERRVQMAVDVAGRRHGVAAVDGAARRILGDEFGRLADRDDAAGVDRDRRVTDDAAARIDRDQPADIGDEKINRLHNASTAHGLFGFGMRGHSRPKDGVRFALPMTRASILLRKTVDGRAKPGHDAERITANYFFASSPT